MQDNIFRRFQILKSLPVYGPMYIPVSWKSEPSYSEGFVVKFFRDDGSEWIANFSPGFTEFCAVVELKSPENLLVIAFGAAYIINPNLETPIEKFSVGICEYVEHLDGRVVLADQTDLTIVEADGKYWTTNRISIDGIKNIEINGDVVSGLCYSLKVKNGSIFLMIFKQENYRVGVIDLRKYNS